MKLHLLDRSSISNSSFTSKVNDYPYFLKIWHYHPELELVHIVKSEGTCFVGDGIEKFQEGDIVLIGKDLPHMWLNDDSYFKENSTQSAKAIAIHFKQDFLGKSFFETPEMIHILELFNRANLGLKFLNVDKKTIKNIYLMMEENGFEKTMAFLNVLNKLAKHKNVKTISSLGFTNSFKASKGETQDKIQSYIYKNFNKKMKLDDVAKIAHMNTSAFSRYFKRINRKTFSSYITEIRIGYACKLLIEDKLSILNICYECGFNNVSNFNRQFKLIMNCTPSNYVKHYKMNISNP